MNDENFVINVASDGYYNCSNCNKKIQTELKEKYIDFGNINKTAENINEYFIENNGICE